MFLGPGREGNGQQEGEYQRGDDPCKLAGGVTDSSFNDRVKYEVNYILKADPTEAEHNLRVARDRGWKWKGVRRGS